MKKLNQKLDQLATKILRERNMGLYDTVRNAKAGEEAAMNAAANKKGMEIADAEIANVQQRQQAEDMANSRAMQREEGAYIQGQADANASQGGLGNAQNIVGSDIGQVQESALRDEAMNIIKELEAAKANGATDEELRGFISQIPPEVSGTVQQVRKEMLAQQANTAPQPQNRGGFASVPTGDASPANQAANSVMQEVFAPKQ